MKNHNKHICKLKTNIIINILTNLQAFLVLVIMLQSINVRGEISDNLINSNTDTTFINPDFHPEFLIPQKHQYHQTLTMKLFLSQALFDGKHKQRDNGKSEVFLNYDQALEVIRKIDNLTLGIPKIVYLVGWQYNGHDSKYPAWFEGNNRLKRTGDANSIESLKWLMKEAGKYHTTVSLHVNMLDAYEDSPLWDEYVKNDPQTLSGFKEQFCLKTVLWYYLNRLNRLKLVNNRKNKTVQFSDGVSTILTKGTFFVIKGKNKLVENNDLLIPALWIGDHILVAYSKNGYKNKSWDIPEDWKGGDNVKISRITIDGKIFLGTEKIDHDKIILSLEKDEMIEVERP